MVNLLEQMAIVTKESFSMENFMAKALRYGLIAPNTLDNSWKAKSRVTVF